jgi:hypothetical protein
MVLITGASLFVRTLEKLWSVDMGYDRENVLMFSVNAKVAGYPNDRASALYREILQRLEALPDVQSASISRVRPADDQIYLVNSISEVDGRKLAEHDSIHIAFNLLAPAYFSTMKIPIVLGRDFDMRDNKTSPKVVVINESLASRALPGQDPVGHRLGDAMIIGVVKDSRYDGAREQPRPVLYRALSDGERDGCGAALSRGTADVDRPVVLVIVLSTAMRLESQGQRSQGFGEGITAHDMQAVTLFWIACTLLLGALRGQECPSAKPYEESGF